MAHKFKKGDSIFFLFKKGETVQDSQLKPRYYLDRTKAEIHLPYYGDEIVEYAPVRHGRWVNEGVYVTTAYGSLDVYKCSICNEEITIDGFDSYCPHCGAKMDGPAEC